MGRYNQVVWKEKEESEIIRLYTVEHLSMRNIGKIFKHEPLAVRKVLIKHNITLKTPANNKITRWTDAQIKEIIKLYTVDGLSLVQISKIMNNKCCKVIKKVLINNSIKIKSISEILTGRIITPELIKRRIVTKEDEIKIVNDYINLKLNTNQISKKYKIHGKSLAKILNKYGYKIRSINGSREKNFSEEQKREILNLYRSGLGVGSLRGKLSFKCSQGPIYNFLHSIGEPLKKLGRVPNKILGWGYKSWYKGNFFRSLMELSYYLNEIEAKNKSFVSGETLPFYIDYELDGRKRTYRPDFFVDGKDLIEIKPKFCQEHEVVIAKKIAAIEFCSRKGYNYIITDYETNFNQIIPLFKNGSVKFNEKDRIRFEKKMNRILRGPRKKISLPPAQHP